MDELNSYLEKLHPIPTARIKLHEFCTLFRATLPPAVQRQWPRKRIVAALEKLYPVGRDAAGVVYVGGLSLTPAPRLVSENGRLRLQSAG